MELRSINAPSLGWGLLVLLAVLSVAQAEARNLTCNGAEIRVDFPPDIANFVREGLETCTFWQDKNNPDYSGYYFGGSIHIDTVGNKKPYPYQSTKNDKDGTWNQLLHTKQIFVSDSAEKYIRIDSGKFKSKFLAKTSAEEEEEKTEPITRIDGKIFNKGIWVSINLALPYKFLTRQQAVEMIKSVEVIKGFDAIDK
ncbi:MAG: hypothetical protein JWQ61_2569 [Collimonas fungivorans]|uniref:hypothetical protein n=1 Tax=Collimonas fungivorans TaxID=158899 RepID=UPI0026E9B93B|nr:hypothetical protein [Collimonas fungivorans]MDB5767755.1 hypothetical protein [Collimonas fungivorans]